MMRSCDFYHVVIRYFFVFFHAKNFQVIIFFYMLSCNGFLGEGTSVKIILFLCHIFWISNAMS